MAHTTMYRGTVTVTISPIHLSHGKKVGGRAVPECSSEEQRLYTQKTKGAIEHEAA